MTMQTTIAPVVPKPRRSRRRWYLLGGLALLLAVPVAYYFIAAWWSDRQMAELTRAIDEEDPTWRWHDLVAEMKPPPDEKNSAVQIAKVHELLQKKNTLGAGGKWENNTLW